MAGKGIICKICRVLLMAVGTPELAGEYFPNGCPKCREASDNGTRNPSSSIAIKRAHDAVDTAIKDGAKNCFVQED